MPESLLRLLDISFVVVHTALVVFIVFGWTVPRLRTAHFAAVGVTAFSWFGIGLFTTIGYCPLTDWHWQVLRALGETHLPRNYIQYLVNRLIGLDVPVPLVDASVRLGFGVASIAALVHARRLVLRAFKRKPA